MFNSIYFAQCTKAAAREWERARERTSVDICSTSVAVSLRSLTLLFCLCNPRCEFNMDIPTPAVILSDIKFNSARRRKVYFMLSITCSAEEPNTSVKTEEMMNDSPRTVLVLANI